MGGTFVISVPPVQILGGVCPLSHWDRRPGIRTFQCSLLGGSGHPELNGCGFGCYSELLTFPCVVCLTVECFELFALRVGRTL